MILNPFLLYSIVWLAVLFFYNLNISELYPKLTLNTCIFIFITVFLNFLIGIAFNKKIQRGIKKFNKINKIGIKKYKLLLVIFFCFLDFYYAKSVPLLMILLKENYSYLEFHGIPIFHGFLLSYTFYFALCSFYDYLKTKNKFYFFQVMVSFLFPMLSYSRAYCLLIICGMLIIFLTYKNKLRYIFISMFIGIFLLYGFGIAGNLRHYYNWNDSSMIKKTAKIDIKETKFDPIFWGYVYFTSPIGNLQNNINNNNNVQDFSKLLVDNLLISTISKKIIKKDVVKSKLMVSNLTVGTLYTPSYLYFGFIGMYFIFFIYTFLNVLYLKILKNNHYFMIGITILALINIFSCFENMYTTAGVGTSLFYPILENLKIIKKRRRS